MSESDRVCGYVTCEHMSTHIQWIGGGVSYNLIDARRNSWHECEKMVESCIHGGGGGGGALRGRLECEKYHAKDC